MTANASRVHRGIAVYAPARSAPRQKARPRLAAIAVPCRPIPLISHLPRRVSAPPRVRRHLFSLHEQGIGSQHRTIAHRYAVVNERADAERAAGTDGASAGLVSAVLLRVTLDDASVIQNTLVPDRGQGRLGDVDAVVEYPAAEPD